MNITEIVNVISSVGFPIVMCVIMFKYLQKNDDKREEDSKEIREAINNNTQIMIQLVDKIDQYKNVG